MDDTTASILDELARSSAHLVAAARNALTALAQRDLDEAYLRGYDDGLTASLLAPTEPRP